MALGQRAEAAGEVDLLARTEILAAYEDDPVGQRGGAQLLHLVVVRLAQVDAGQLGADAAGQAAGGDGGRSNIDGHGSSRFSGRDS